MDDFEVAVNGEKVVIPYRIHSTPPSDLFLGLSTEETRLRTYCNYTRHHDGYLREKYLQKIIGADTPMVMPYILQVCGEYVVELVQYVFENKDRISHVHMRDFINSNPSYYQKTRDRMVSYWNCYYRHQYPELSAYVGHKLFSYFDRLRRIPFNTAVNTDVAHPLP